LNRLQLVRGELLAVAVGGALGATARYEAVRTWPVAVGTFPTTVLAVNLVASALLGLFLALLDDGRGAWGCRPVVRGALVAGVVGGFGTLSLVSVELAQLVADGHGGTAVAYASATIVGGITLVTLGLLAGGWRPAWHSMPEEDEL
jgi:CrcB protein